MNPPTVSVGSGRAPVEKYDSDHNSDDDDDDDDDVFFRLALSLCIEPKVTHAILTKSDPQSDPRSSDPRRAPKRSQKRPTIFLSQK